MGAFSFSRILQKGPASVQTALEFRDVHKAFGQKEVLRGVSFSVNPGEIVGFLGPNGSGKTTAISIAVGLLHASKGQGSMLGHAFGDPAGRVRLGYLPDNPVFFSHSATDAIRFAAKLQGVPSRELRERVASVIKAVPIASTKQQARRLSRGQQQYLALAQALVNDPQLLILDEPTSALDPSAVMQVRELLKAARDNGKSIFFSSHQLTEVERICDRVLFLHEGRIARQGTLQELTESTDTFVLSFRGLPASAAVWRHLDLAPATSAGIVTVTVTHANVRPVIETLWAAGGELLELTQQRQSLENLFQRLASTSKTENQS
ncbi:MAG TPA: ABC transporter ATP-binding protein [Acidobacteriaceae bacterium]|jgi:ABC-2 type transport system ATP-binding protein|nr:ABC transporter ATP-binding protein [Acidobacteriaceae bacterium]